MHHPTAYSQLVTIMIMIMIMPISESHPIDLSSAAGNEQF
jgi:hypothetical protein